MLCLPCGLLLSQQPEGFESLLAAAQEAQSRSDFQAAAEYYRKAVALHPEIPELRTNLGLMYYQTEKDEQAAVAFREALRLKPELFVPNLFLGLDYVRLKRFKEAVPYLKRAARLKPTDTQAQLGLGQAYAGAGDNRLAIASYLHATETARQDPDGWYHLGMSYLEQVEADARILLTRHKESAYVPALVADNLSDEQAFAPAAEAYKRALLLPLCPAGSHANYGFVLIHLRDLAGAEREFDAELKRYPGWLMAKLGFARLQWEQGATEEAANGIQEISKTDSGFLRTNIATLKAGVAQSKRSELQRILEQKVAAGDLSADVVSAFRVDSSSDPNLQNAVGKQGIAAASSKSTSVAAEFYAAGKYRRCSDRLASQVRTLPAGQVRLLVVCAYSTGDYEHSFQAAQRLAASVTTEDEGLYWETKSAQKLASEALERASKMDSGSPKLHVLLGDLYRQRNLFPDAEHEYQKALTLAPNDIGALFGLSLALLADNQLDQAFNVAQTALQNNVNDPELNAVMGEILYARNDLSGAEAYLNKSLNTKPEYVSHVHALLGSVYAKTNRTQEAIAELKLALSDDKDGHIHYQIGRLYLKVGYRNLADEAFEISNRLRSEGLNRAAVSMKQTSAGDESQ